MSVTSLARNSLQVLSNSKMLGAYAYWKACRMFGQKPTLKLPFDSRLSHARSFSEFWTTRFLIFSDGEVAYLKDACSGAETLFDVGANVGVFTVLLGKLNSKAQIFSFEPCAQTAEVLDGNVALNKLENVTVVVAAVTNKVGELTFVNVPGSAATSHIKPDGSSESGTTVPAVSLDAFVDREKIIAIDFLKVDVEGAEVLLVEGAKRLLSNHLVRKGMIEICPENLRKMGYNTSELIDRIESFGYRLYEILDSGKMGKLIKASDVPEDAIWNVALCPSESMTVPA